MQMMTFKERPILFSSPMIRAILAGNKTQTRRVIKPPNGYNWLSIDAGTMVNSGGHKKHVSELKFKQGKIGDHLWVREKWYQCGRSIMPMWEGADADDGIITEQPNEQGISKIYRTDSDADVHIENARRFVESASEEIAQMKKELEETKAGLKKAIEERDKNISKLKVKDNLITGYFELTTKIGRALMETQK